MNKKSETQKFWNNNPCCGDWTSIDKLISWRNFTEPYYQKLLSKIDTKGKVLEVGCGQGIEFIQNLEKGIEIIGFDYSRESLKKTKLHYLEKIKRGELKNKKCIIMNGDAENLPFMDKSFSFVYSLGVLHHTPNTKKGIDEIHRVLKHDGLAIVMLYNRLSWRSFPISFMRFVSKFLDFILRTDKLIYRSLKKKYERLTDHVAGTAMLEMFGCPVLKMYSARNLRKMFSNFSSVEIECYSSNLFQLSYFLPLGKKLTNIMRRVDKKVENKLGFHIVAICKK